MKTKEKREYFKKYEEGEITEIKKKLNSMHIDIKKMIEYSHQEYFNLIQSNLKNEFLSSINGYMLEKTDEVLNEKMVSSCDMKEQCKIVFKKYLKNHTKDLSPDNVTEEKIKEAGENLEELRKIGPYDKCDICFDEVNDMFENQINLVSSLRIYETLDEKDDKEISAIDEVSIVKDVLEPVANKQRLQILKSITLEPKTFSDLSKITKLRGGNLLFHIQKLQNTDLIMQKHERGEYILTKKGFKIINIIRQMQNS